MRGPLAFTAGVPPGEVQYLHQVMRFETADQHSLRITQESYVAAGRLAGPAEIAYNLRTRSTRAFSVPPEAPRHQVGASPAIYRTKRPVLFLQERPFWFIGSGCGSLCHGISGPWNPNLCDAGGGCPEWWGENMSGGPVSFLRALLHCLFRPLGL